MSIPQRFFLITFRPHIAESSILDDFLTIFLQSSLVTGNKHSWCVDNDKTMEQHMHMIIQANYKDKYAFTRSKQYREATGKIQEFCKGRQTKWQHAEDTKMVGDKNEDFMKTLGYVNKELYNRPRNGKKDFNDKEILDAVEYYYACEHLDKGKLKKSDWKYLNTKNAHSMIEDFCDKNSLKPNDWKVTFEMKKNKYSFCQLTERNQDDIFEEICISQSMTPEKTNDSSEMLKNYDEPWYVNENRALLMKITAYEKMLDMYDKDWHNKKKHVIELFNKSVGEAWKILDPQETLLTHPESD